MKYIYIIQKRVFSLYLFDHMGVCWIVCWIILERIRKRIGGRRYQNIHLYFIFNIISRGKSCSTGFELHAHTTSKVFIQTLTSAKRISSFNFNSNHQNLLCKLIVIFSSPFTSTQDIPTTFCLYFIFVKKNRYLFLPQKYQKRAEEWEMRNTFIWYWLTLIIRI